MKHTRLAIDRLRLQPQRSTLGQPQPELEHRIVVAVGRPHDLDRARLAEWESRRVLSERPEAPYLLDHRPRCLIDLCLRRARAQRREEAAPEVPEADCDQSKTFPW